jgi:tRNA A37 threonylcarbamoyltransferase TsaD
MRYTRENIVKILYELAEAEAKKPVDRVLKIVGGVGAIEELNRIFREEIEANHDGSFSITKPPN